MFSRKFVGLLLVVLLAAGIALAQTGARLEGTVQDQTGALVPNAKITAVNVKTQETKTASSNAQGFYAIVAVTPGIYTVTAEAQGFAKSVIADLEVNVATTVAANFKLQVGASTQSVEVSAAAVTVQTTDSQAAGIITLKDINTLPQLGRNPIGLAVYQPGTQINADDSSFTRINGTREGSNNATLDGIDVNDSSVPRLGLSMTANNTDSVGEFRIVTEGAKAEYGRSAGGQIEMITRSGTNSFHGNAYDYIRNTDLNANEYFNKQSGQERPKFIQNMFGASFGGPIFKNKTFFFGNYQGRRTSQERVRNRTVYTANARAGIFTYKKADGTLGTYDVLANDPRGLGWDPAVKALVDMTPECNNADVGDSPSLDTPWNTCGFRFNQPANSTEDQFTVRGDHNLTASNKVFLRWSRMRTSSIDVLNNTDTPFPGGAQGTQGGIRWGYSVGNDWSITPSLVNEFRFGHQSASVDFLRPQRLAGPAILPNTITNPILSNFGQGRNSPVNDLIDNMTKMYKSHLFKFGGKWSHTTQDGYNYANVYPNVSLSSTTNGNTPVLPPELATALLDTNTASTQQTNWQQFYNNVLGRMSQVSQTFYSTDLSSWQATGSPRVRDYILNEYGFYVQDDWRVARNLTLNLGLRYELYMPPVERNKIQGGLVDPGQVQPGATNDALTIQRTTHWYKTDTNNFAPRAGFAWDIMGDGKTALRGNYGIFYDRIIGATVSFADTYTPGFATGAATTPQLYTAADITAMGCGSAPVGDVRISDCLPAVPQPAAPQLTPPITPSGKNNIAIAIFNPNLRTGYTHSFNLNVQRELFRNTVVEVAYLGNRGKKLFMDRDYNQKKTDAAFQSAFNAMRTFATAGFASKNATSLPALSNPFMAVFQQYNYQWQRVKPTDTPPWYAPTEGVPCSGQPNPNLCYGASALVLLGSTNFVNNNLGIIADNFDIGYSAWYEAAGLPDNYLSYYPQVYNMIVGSNDGMSSYDALQVSLRRTQGDLKTVINYTYSKSLDNISVDGNGFTSPIDNFNPMSNKARGDTDHRNSLNASAMYTLPIGRTKPFLSNIPNWLDTFIGGWDLGGLLTIQDGSLFSISSGRYMFSNMRTSYIDWPDIFNGKYLGSRNGQIMKDPATGKVMWFNADQIANIAYPALGSKGTSGRNGFRGPGYFNIDTSLVKKFRITESHALTFRWESYNLLNHANFANPGTTVFTASFGRISSVNRGSSGTGARVMQMTLRYDF